jgi:hypothetical protein
MAEARFDPPQVPVTVVAHVARDAAEAQVIAANLTASGIPAYVENAALVDEYAMSQKLRVLVTSDRVEEAREFIADPPKIGDDELEAQAMAASIDDEPSRRPVDHPLVILFAPLIVGILFWIVFWLISTMKPAIG